jgi:hypothetical protein
MVLALENLRKAQKAESCAGESLARTSMVDGLSAWKKSLTGCMLARIASYLLKIPYPATGSL